jgi:glycosyltransferase involved in cell wall biosynthesis
MPAYNAEDYVEQAVESVRQQGYSDWELIAIDDCSGDSTAEKLEALQDRDRRITVLRNSENLGPAHSRNRAIERATGRYIAFLDADDWWKPEFLQEMLTFMERRGAAVAYASYDRVAHDGQYIDTYTVPKKTTYRSLLQSCPITCLTGIYDRSIAGTHYFDDVPREDLSLWVKLLRLHWPAYGNRRSLAAYRIQMSSRSRNKMEMIRGQWYMYRRYLGFSLLPALLLIILYGFNGIKKYFAVFLHLGRSNGTAPHRVEKS